MNGDAIESPRRHRVDYRKSEALDEETGAPSHMDTHDLLWM